METTWLWFLLGLVSVPLFVAVNGLFVAAEFAVVGNNIALVTEWDYLGSGSRFRPQNWHEAAEIAWHGFRTCPLVSGILHGLATWDLSAIGCGPST